MLLVNFATKTEVIGKNNKTINDFWPIGIDYGFSGVKGFAPNKVFCYPNCAVKQESYNTLLEAEDSDIVLKDKDGIWIVGEKAHEVISTANAMNYEAEMYERNRYFSPIFRALMKVGLGIALMGNSYRKYNGETIVVQTGLPPKYKDQDTDLLKDTLAGNYDFELKIGKRPFQHYRFTIKESDIFIMDQPMGSLISTITDNNGIQSPADCQVLRSNTLVVDPGFKTLDIFDIVAGMFKGSNTFDTLGMHEVFRRTANKLQKKYGAKLTVSGMQNTIHKGYAMAFDRRQMKNTKIYFEEDLYNSSKEVCDEAIQKLVSIYDYLQNHDYMIITGGTGNAWFSFIEDYFRNMDGLIILSANKNDTTLSNTYSNVRGYYFFLINRLERRRR